MSTGAGRQKKQKSEVFLSTCWITYRHTLFQISFPNTHSRPQKYPHPGVPLVWCTPPTFPCYLQRSPLTHLAAGLRCALSNNELCIRCCHFEKCNYLSDKADGPVLSGICCASIKSSVGWKTLSSTHKQGTWKPTCINSLEEGKALRSESAAVRMDWFDCVQMVYGNQCKSI